MGRPLPLATRLARPARAEVTMRPTTLAEFASPCPCGRQLRGLDAKPILLLTPPWGPGSAMLGREDVPMRDWPAEWAMVHAVRFEAFADDDQFRALFRHLLDDSVAAPLKEAMPPELFTDVMAAVDAPPEVMRRTGKRLGEWARERLGPPVR
jgi:hypothetical protein